MEFPNPSSTMLSSNVHLGAGRVPVRRRKAVPPDQRQNVHKLGDANLNQFFKAKTGLMMYYDPDWIPEPIVDAEITTQSMLCAARLTETKRVKDPISGKERLEETELVKRIKAQGFEDVVILALASIYFPTVDKEGKSTDPGSTMTRHMSELEEFKDFEKGLRLNPC